MGGPLDVLGKHFYTIILVWGIVVLVAFLWVAVRVWSAVKVKRRAIRQSLAAQGHLKQTVVPSGHDGPRN
jgi:hypothetical protein